MKQAWLVGALLLNLAIVVAAALVVVQQTRPPATQQPVPPPQIAVAPVIAPAAPAPVIVSGRIIGESLLVKSTSHALVKETVASAGQQVETDSVLLVLDDPELTERVRLTREGEAALASNLADADALLSTLREEVPQQIWAAEQKAADARSEVAESQEKFDQVSRIAWRLEKKAREKLAASQIAEPAKLRAILEKDAEVEALAAKLKAASYRISLYESQSQLAQTEHDLALAQVSSQKIETLAANVRIQHMQAQQAARALQDYEAELAALTIRSPEAGTVMSVDVKPGQKVETGDHLLTMWRIDSLYFESRISSTDASAIEPGQLAEIRVDEWPEKRFKARIVEVRRRAEEVDSSDQVNAGVMANIVRLEILDNSEGLLKPDMAAHTILRSNAGPAKNHPIPSAADVHAGEAK